MRKLLQRNSDLRFACRVARLWLEFDRCCNVQRFVQCRPYGPKRSSALDTERVTHIWHPIGAIRTRRNAAQLHRSTSGQSKFMMSWGAYTNLPQEKRQN